MLDLLRTSANQASLFVLGLASVGHEAVGVIGAVGAAGQPVVIIAMAHAVEGGDELIIVLSTLEDVPVVNAAHHDVVDAGARGFAGLSGHSISPNFWQRYEEGR